MAPLGISLVNLLIESSSLSCLAEGRQTKKEQGFAQNCSSESSREPSTSPPSSNTTNLFFRGGGSGSVGGGTTAASNGTTSSQPYPKATISSSHTENDGTNLNNNNNYFSEGSQRENPEKGERRSSAENNFRAGEPSSSSFSSTQKLYSIFWEKFKKPCDQKEANTSYRPFSTAVGPEGVSQESKQKNNGEAEHFKNIAKSAVSSDDKSSSSSSTYKKFYEKAQQINNQLLPVWSLLSYPSDLHYYGRAAVMTVVTANVIGKTLEKLPDIEQLGKRYGPLFQCNLLDGSDPNQPGRVGLDKDFF